MCCGAEKSRDGFPLLRFPRARQKREATRAECLARRSPGLQPLLYVIDDRPRGVGVELVIIHDELPFPSVHFIANSRVALRFPLLQTQASDRLERNSSS